MHHAILHVGADSIAITRYNDLARGLHNLCKIAVPRGISESMLWILLKCLYAVCGQSGGVLAQDFVCLDVWWWAPAIFLGLAVVYALLPVVHKWLLTGMYGSLWLLCLIPARSHQMWSAWLWRDEIHYEVSQMIDKQVHPFISGAMHDSDRLASAIYLAHNNATSYGRYAMEGLVLCAARCSLWVTTALVLNQFFNGGSSMHTRMHGWMALDACWNGCKKKHRYAVRSPNGG